MYQGLPSLPTTGWTRVWQDHWQAVLATLPQGPNHGGDSPPLKYKHLQNPKQLLIPSNVRRRSLNYTKTSDTKFTLKLEKVEHVSGISVVFPSAGCLWLRGVNRERKKDESSDAHPICTVFTVKHSVYVREREGCGQMCIQACSLNTDKRLHWLAAEWDK